MYCKNCGKEIDDKAAVCVFCGVATNPPAKKKPFYKKWWFWAIIVIVIVIIASSGNDGGENNDGPNLVATEDTNAPDAGNDPTETQAPTSAPQTDAPETAFGVGDTAENDGVYVTFVGVTEGGGENEFLRPTEGNVYVACEFTIENKSDKELNISSLMSFETYVDDYSASLSLSAVSATEGKDSLDGTVAPGKKLTGILAYEVAEDWKTIEIHFEPDVWSSDEFVFVHTK